MPTAKQLENRVNYVTSTDVPAILGLHPQKTAGDVRIEKREKILPHIDNSVLERGRLLEGSILEYAGKHLGPLVSNQFRTARGIPKLAAHIDAVVRESKEPVEAKSSRMFADVSEVPPHIDTQCHVHMLCTDKDVCHLPVFLRDPFDYELFQVSRDERLARLIEAIVPAFWEDIVEGDVELTADWYRTHGLKVDPDRIAPSHEMMRIARREEGKVIDLGENVVELVREWGAKQREQTAVSKEKTRLRDAIEAALGDAEVGVYEDTDDDGNAVKRAVTFKSEKRAKMEKVGKYDLRVLRQRKNWE